MRTEYWPFIDPDASTKKRKQLENRFVKLVTPKNSETEYHA